MEVGRGRVTMGRNGVSGSRRMFQMVLESRAVWCRAENIVTSARHETAYFFKDLVQTISVLFLAIYLDTV